MSSNHQDALLEEYRSCGEQVTRLDTLIWQTASIIFPITLAGFALFGLPSSHTAEQFFVIAVTAVGSITLLITWYLLSYRWYVYEHVAFYRMREIEDELGLWHRRYAFFVRVSPRKQRLALQDMSDDEKSRLQKLSSQVGNVPFIGLRTTTTIITTIFVAGWVALIVREYILTF